MKIQPKKHTFYIKNKPVTDKDIARNLAIIFVFVSVYGFAIKLIFF